MGNRRLSPSKTRRKFGSGKSRRRFTDLANILARALRADFGALRSAVKHIALITHAHPDTVSKWYQGKNVPNSEHLILLARSSPSLANAIVELASISRSALASVPLEGSCKKIPQPSIWQLDTAKTAHGVTTNVTINLNSRQNWFVLHLSQGEEIRPADIAEHWRVSLRTAKRDIRAMKSRGIVTYVGHPRRGRYIIGQLVPD